MTKICDCGQPLQLANNDDPDSWVCHNCDYDPCDWWDGNDPDDWDGNDPDKQMEYDYNVEYTTICYKFFNRWLEDDQTTITV